MLTRVSASQVQDYALCKRKWYISHVLKEKAPETESLRIGTAVHTELEQYLLTGQVRESPWKEHVALAAPFLPMAPVRPSVHVERWIEMPTFSGGPKWVGKVDVLDASEDVLAILDHKTCKTFAHVLTPENIGNNIQMAAYGHYGLTTGAFLQKNRVTIRLTHTYIKVSGTPKIKPVTAVVSSDTISETWDKALTHVEGMQKTSLLPVWKDVEPNTESCGAYGRCPYREKCGFTNVIEQLKGSNTMSEGLLDRLKREKAKTGTELEALPIVVSKKEDKPTEVIAQGIIPPDAPSRTSSPIEVKDVSTPKKAKKAREEEQEKPSPITGQEIPDFTIYIDSYPVRGSATPPILFELLVAPIAEAVALECGVADIRHVKYEAKARLSVAIKAKLHTFPPVIVVSSMANFADTFLEVLVPKAKVVVGALKGIV